MPVMVTRQVEPRLLGRDREREVLERLLEGVRDGHGGVLVLHGEPGVGKTALLEFAVENGQDFRVVRTAGVEGEMELPYAALQQLCSPIIELADRLPDPQRDALAVAFGVPSARRPIRSSSGLPSSVCCRRWPRRARCSAWSTTRSGWTMRRLARWRSSRAGCSRRRSRSLFAARERGNTLAGFPEINVGPLGRRDARDPAGVCPAGSR